MEEEEDRDSGKIFAVKAEAKPSVEEPKVDIKQIVEACMKEMQAQQPKKQQSERPRSSRRKLRCWCCRKEGHTMRACPLVQQNKAADCKQKAEKRVPESANGARWYQRVSESARGCQMVPMGARWCQRVPEDVRRTRLGQSWPQDWVRRPI